MRRFKELFLSDLYRYKGSTGFGAFLKCYYTIPGVRYSFWLRLCTALAGRRAWFLVYLFARLRLRHYSFKFGFDISHQATIGPGLYIGHFGGIIVNAKAKIGKNVNLSQGVTIGQANRGSRQGCAEIGDCVYIGPGAKIVGHVIVGDHAAIGANAVVTKDVPNNAVVGGIPAKVLSYNGSAGYVNRVVK